MKEVNINKKALISGITGQDGSYLAELLLSKGYEVYGIQRRTSTITTERIDDLIDSGKITNFYGDLADANSIVNILLKVRPDEIYNIGSMSHVRVSFDVPEYTAQVTGVGPTRILEALRSLEMTDVKFYQASSSEMFGISPPPQNEETPFRPQSPYGCAKLYAYWMTRAYRTGYNMFACNGILFNHECIAGQTPIIIRKSGHILIVPIEDIVPHPNEHCEDKYSTIDGELEIWDYDKWSKVLARTATWHEDREIVQVASRGGYYEATPDHISYRENGEEVETSILRTTDRLKLGTLPNLPLTTYTSPEETELLGMMVADGSVNTTQGTNGRFTNNDNKLNKKQN